MGRVWGAHHLELDVPVALKFMAPSLVELPDARERFKREARAAAALRSPHVVQVLDFGVEDDTPYIVMERLVGEDLSARLARTGRLGLDEAAVMLTQAAKALDLAAEAGVVHCDLKPANVFLARSGRDESVKILDFGVARWRSSGGPATNGWAGSPHYMSPEQATSQPTIDHRSDLWSLAVILFRAVVGQRPFEGQEVGDVILAILELPIPKPTERDASLPRELDAFFLKALAREPGARFRSAGEMAAAFARVAASAPPSEITAEHRPPLPPGDAPPDVATLLTVSTQSGPAAAARKRSRAAWVVGGAALAVAAAATLSVPTVDHAAPAPEATSPSPAGPPAPSSDGGEDAVSSALAVAVEPRAAPSPTVPPPPTPSPPADAPSGASAAPVRGPARSASRPTLAAPPAPQPTPATAAAERPADGRHEVLGY